MRSQNQIDRRASYGGTERGLRRKSRGPEGPSLRCSGPVWERRGARGGKGTFQGRTAASEGGRHEQSLTILRSVPIPGCFLSSRVLVVFPVGPCRVCRAVPCRAVLHRTVQVPFLPSFLPSFLLSFLHVVRDATRCEPTLGIELTRIRGRG